MSSHIEWPVIGFAGLSHLGLVSAIAAAAKGFQVVGYDANETLVKNLQQKIIPIEEPDLDPLLKSHTHQISFSHKLDALRTCDVIYVSLDVATNEKNESDVSQIHALIEEVALIRDPHAVLVILSQVSPGFTRTLSVPKNHLFYQVETLIFGQAVHRALHPERFIIGCAEVKNPLPKALEFFLKSFHCPILPMRYESAELAKIAINLFLASSVTTANVLAEIAGKIGADWNEIIPTLRLDKRMGPHAYLQPGLGIAGGNIERDLASIIRLGEQYHANIEAVLAYCQQSDYQKDWVYRCLEQIGLDQFSKITLLGLAYKANTHSVKNAPSLVLLPKLRNHEVCVHDPIVSQFDGGTFVKWYSNYEDAVAEAEVLVILTPWSCYSSLEASWLKETMSGRYVIDPFQVLNHTALSEVGFTIFTLGKAPLVSTNNMRVEEYV